MNSVAPNPEENTAFGLRVSKVRHDLRNSIGHILGFADMLLEEAQEQKRAGLCRELELICTLANRMSAQVNESLDAPKIRSAPTELRAFEKQIGTAAEEIVAATDRLARESRAANDEVFQEDLMRISGAARHALESVRTALAALGSASEDKGTSFTTLQRRWSPIRLKPPALNLMATGGTILVVDDLAENRELLDRRLARMGYVVHAVESGQRALEFVAGRPVDLILLDIMMPGVNGIEVLRQLKADAATRHIPVVMLSSTDQADTVVNCIQLGADDFLPKPFNPTLLMARIESSLNKKRLHDQEVHFLQQLQAERDVSERLLLNILPPPVAERLKRGEEVIADGFSEVTVLFSDFVGFTKYSAATAPKELVSRLNEIFSAFDQLCDQHGLEKIKMIGDAFMVAGGVPTPRPDHAAAVATLALAMHQEVARIGAERHQPFRMRVGLNSGPVVAGVIGRKKFAYDLWGDTVNLASRLESHAAVGGILVSSATHKLLKGQFRFGPSRSLRIKGKGRATAYPLLGKA